MAGPVRYRIFKYVRRRHSRTISGEFGVSLFKKFDRNDWRDLDYCNGQWGKNLTSFRFFYTKQRLVGRIASFLRPQIKTARGQI